MTHPRHGTILVIDDEEIMREILETLLVREGYHVRVASTGTEGIELARSMRYCASWQIMERTSSTSRTCARASTSTSERR